MKKMILKSLLLASVCAGALPVLAQQFIDCSEGNASCDVLYATEENFVAAPGEQIEGIQVADLLKTTDKPLAESNPASKRRSIGRGVTNLLFFKKENQNEFITSSESKI